MNLKISLLTLSAVAASIVVLPAQAGVLTTTKNVGGNISTAAYRIEGLTVGTLTYDVDFKHGEFNTIFPTGSQQYFNDDADVIGEAIVAALNGAGAVHVINRISAMPDVFGENAVNQFQIPIALGQNNNENFLSICEIGGVLTMACHPEPRSMGGSLMYAKLSAATAASSNTPVPTPALMPGLLGMGLATLRKKQAVA
jgi:hypothetical protein